LRFRDLLCPGLAANGPLADYRVADQGTDAHPVFLGNRILIKDDATLRLLRIPEELP
jgi:hypothetical protein